MKRALTVAGLVLTSLFVHPQRAAADWWDWLQELSGPGPFHTNTFNAMVDLCPGPPVSTDKEGNVLRENGKVVAKGHFLRDFEFGEKQVQTDQHGSPVATTLPKCFFMDFRRFRNREDDNFIDETVDLNVIELGISVRLHHAIVVGFGGGATQIVTPNHTAWKGVFTGPRLVIKPLLLYGTSQYWANHDWLHLIFGSVKYYVKENTMLGHVRGKDFGLKATDPNYTFDFQNDRVASTGFILDFTDLAIVLLRQTPKFKTR